jgi:hypothetical protein
MLETYIFFEKPFRLAIRFRKDALENNFLVFPFFDGLIN